MGEILDVCDVHLAFLHPGAFGELKLKKCCGTLPSPSLDPSPPEFPAWSNTVQSIPDTSGLQGFVNCDILQAYLNIKPEPIALARDSVVYDVTESTNISLPLTGANTSTADMPAIMPDVPLSGGNTVTSTDDQEVVIKSANREHGTYRDNLELQKPLTTEANDSATTMDNVDDLMTPQNSDDAVSPIKLKKACIQTLLQSVPHTDPMSLFKTCLDVMSWNSEQYFPGNLLLPWSLNTSTHVMELKRITLQPSPTPKLADVILYDHVRVHSLIKKLWLRQVSVWKYSVPLNKLTATQIAAWQNQSTNNSWENIDPYSSLEDIGSTSS